MFKVNNKDNRTTEWRRSGIASLENILHLVLQCSFVDIEQVNAHWEKRSISDVKQILKIRPWFLKGYLKSASRRIYSREIPWFSGLRSWCFTEKQKLRISNLFLYKGQLFSGAATEIILVKYVMFWNLLSKP